ncbi:hypothetical protein TRFO_17218 [Tritrichomonas foetus]|uniref:Nucleoplasmin-like domain-containing protein n=1 Tax=Tritrichomonas foetus TaxID=1144522 RepID=A0A1J4KSR9_9EUKA|nr:hypothetical protein TRFO_17218 [Tritrichomonas foetus]|eukprot:OHT12844.1 hypothetical protein TRFO_17218 [Tritrichomonas foetus]
MIEVPAFWQLELKPNSEPVSVKFPDDSYLTITNACLPLIDEAEIKQEPVRLLAHIETDAFDSETLKAIKTEKTSVLITSLVPGVNEHASLNVLFSPFDYVTLELKGNHAIHLTGIISQIEDEEFEGEEEEEEEAHEEVKE